MPVLTIADRVLEVGATHPDRQLFDCLMPTPHGTTYNAYLVSGDRKTALIDAVDPDKVDVLMRNLADSGVEKIDYLIHLHTEQDHSGTHDAVLRRYPTARTIATQKVKDLLLTHLRIAEDDVDVIADGGTLDLGGRTLRFLSIPFAHWPDNTMLWLEEERILFSSDLFGSHYATDKAFSTSGAEVQQAAKAYYAEIMMPFRSQVAKHTARARELAPRLIAPAHGPVWYDPLRILSAYERWTGDQVKRLVTIPYVSMHNSTRVMIERMAIRLSSLGVSTVCRDVGSRTDSLCVETGHYILDLVDSAGVIWAVPTVLGGPHPNMAYVAMLTSALRPKTRFSAMIGSFGWGGKTEETMQTLTAAVKAERLPSVWVKGLPTEADEQRLDELAADLSARILAIPDLVE